MDDGSSGGLTQEVSAGGVVVGPSGTLMIKVRNTEGRTVWTFPKGHLENGETPEQAAVREVREETGWRCEVKGSFFDARYQFRKRGRTVEKVVHWFRMEALDRTGEWDPEEVLDCRWVPVKEAKELVIYPSDVRIVEKLENGDDA